MRDSVRETQQQRTKPFAFMIPFVWISLRQLMQTQGIFVFLSTLLTEIFVKVLKAKNKTKKVTSKSKV